MEAPHTIPKNPKGLLPVRSLDQDPVDLPGVDHSPHASAHDVAGQSGTGRIPPKNASLDFNSSATESFIDDPGANPDVWVHIYHCDPYTGFLNRAILSRAEIGIYHAGIEVFGEEWSFQYFEDTWNDSSISGLIRCMPKKMADYEYHNSVNLGPTPLSEDEVDHLLLALHCEWPASSYHLTHNNCLTFAERFVGQLRTPRPFPTWLKGILEASQHNSGVDAIVDYSWSWVKWWMIRKHRQEEDLRQRKRDEGSTTSTCGGQQEKAVWAGTMFSFDSICSGTLCPGEPRRGCGCNAAEESRCSTAMRAGVPHAH